MAPRDRHDPDRYRRIEEARTSNMHSSAGRDPDGQEPGPGGPRQPPMRVHIVGADHPYYEGFSSQLSDQRAVVQAAKGITDELRTAATMAAQFRIASSEAQAKQLEAIREVTRVQQEHLTNLMRQVRQGDTGSGRRRGKGGAAPREEEPNRPAGPSTPIGGQYHPDMLDLDDLAAGGTGRPTGRRRRPAGARPPRGPGGPPPSTPAAPTPDDQDPGPQAGDDDRTNFDRQRARWQKEHGHKLSMHGMRRHLRQRIGEGIHDYFGQGTKNDGTLHPRYDDNEELTHYDFQHPDGTWEKIAKDSRRVPGLTRAAASQRAISGVGAAISRGGAMAAVRAVPFVGEAVMAAEALNTGAKFVTDQRAENAKYQSIYAGSNLQGMGQRLQEEGFVFGQRFTGGMTEEQSRQAFQGVSQMGFKGGERSNMLGFASDAYKQLGVDVSTSLQLIQTASSHANTNLIGLHTALQDVGKMARATGQNANVLYQSLAQNYELTAQAGFGVGAAPVAAGMTGIGIGSGRDFANVDASGITSNQMMRRAAAGTGRSATQLGADVARGNTQAYTEGIDKIGKSTNDSYLNSIGAGDSADKIIQQAGGADAVLNDPGKLRNAAYQFIDQNGSFDAASYKQMMSDTTGIKINNITDTEAAEWALKMRTGKGSLTEKTNEAKAKMNQRDLTGADNYQGDSVGKLTNRAMIGSLDRRDVPGSDFVRNMWSINPFSSEGQQKNTALKAYGALQGDTKKSDPVIESLINSVGNQSDVGIKVSTKDGDKVVPLDEAIKDYSDQLGKGTASVVGGSNDGQQISNFIGAESNIDPSKDSSKSDNQGGVSEDDWKKAHPTDQTAATGETGKVTISPSPELMRLFNFSPSGNAKMEAGASSGVPPAIGR